LIPGWESNSHELLSVNIPWKAELATPLLETSLAPTHFHALFGEVGELEFRHKFQGLKTIEREQDAAVSGLPTDIHALEASQVSVTPLWFRMTGRLSAAQRSQLA